MQRRHARYPFLANARAAVREADVDLATLVSDGGPIVDRGRDRIVHAIDDGRVGPPHHRTRVELLSYPVARVLVSLVDQAVLTQRYATAEARTAIERFQSERSTEALRSTDNGLELVQLLEEFDLADSIKASDGDYDVDVTTYLSLTEGQDGEAWRLVDRELVDGIVPIEREELFRLLEAAITDRVTNGLPLSVPETVAEALTAEVSAIREHLADIDLPRDIDAVEPGVFPPCMVALLDRIRNGEDLEPHSRFAITGFLTSIGMDPDEVVDFYGLGSDVRAEITRYQATHIRSDGGATEYAPPSCATMQAYGDCVNMDDLCETIPHPLTYYETALDRFESESLEN